MAAIRFSLLGLVSLIAACNDTSSDPAPAPPPRAVAVAGHCEARRFEGTAFTLCRYDARNHDLALAVDGAHGPLRSFAELGRTLGPRRAGLLFAMNAGMYDDRGMPIGLYVERGRRRHAVNLNSGPGNFHMKPNGVFAVAPDGRVAIVPSDRLGSLPFQPRWATQSGPMLVIGGRLHPAFQPNGPSLHVRNGVGVDGPNSAWFAISDEPVSFGRFARLFRDALHCPDALFFDGTVSGLWDPAAGRQDDDYPIGPMVAVFRKPAPRR